MQFMHEDLIHEHTERLHDDFVLAHGAQEARRARRRGVRWSWRRSQPASLTPVGPVAPVRTVEPVAWRAVGRSAAT